MPGVQPFLHAESFVARAPRHPMTDRRAFVTNMFAAGIAAPMLNSSAVRPLATPPEIARAPAPLPVAGDEDHWGEIPRALPPDATLTNPNNSLSCTPPARP